MEGGKLAPSGIWTESRFGKLWAGSSREVTLETQGEGAQYPNQCIPMLWEHRTALATATFPMVLYYEHPENARMCELYLCDCFEMSLPASRSSRHTY